MRDVYFDPFGSYTQGYDRGTQRQMDLEANTRAARDSDYRFNVLNPYELKSIKREDAFGEATQPGRLQLFNDTVGMSGNNLYSSNLGIADRFAMDTGAFQPALNMQTQRFGVSASPGQAVAQSVAPYNVAPTAAPQQNAGAAPQQNAGQVFWDAWSKVQDKSPQNAQVVAASLAQHYGVPMEQLQAMIVQNQPIPTSVGEAYPGARAPAPADLAPYNIGTAQPQAPQMQAPPMQAPTVFRDAAGNVLSTVPNMQEQYLGRLLRPEMVQDRAAIIAGQNNYFDQLRQIEQLKHDNEYNRLLHEQNMRGTGAAGTVDWTGAF